MRNVRIVRERVRDGISARYLLAEQPDKRANYPCLALSQGFSFTKYPAKIAYGSKKRLGGAILGPSTPGRFFA